MWYGLGEMGFVLVGVWVRFGWGKVFGEVGLYEVGFV